MARFCGWRPVVPRASRSTGKEEPRPRTSSPSVTTTCTCTSTSQVTTPAAATQVPLVPSTTSLEAQNGTVTPQSSTGAPPAPTSTPSASKRKLGLRHRLPSRSFSYVKSSASVKPTRPPSRSTGSTMNTHAIAGVAPHTGAPHGLSWRKKSATSMDMKVHASPEEERDDRDETSSESSKSSSSSSSHAGTSKANAAKPLQAVYSFVNSTSTFWRGRRQTSSSGVSGPPSASRSVSDISESDFGPLPQGSFVSTKYGLGTVIDVRDDGMMVIRLQTTSPMMLYTVGDDEVHSIPALLHDEVQTPSGDGCIARYDAHAYMYYVRLKESPFSEEVRVAPCDVQRRGSLRKRSESVSTISRSLSSALKTIVSTSSGISTSTYSMMSSYLSYGQFVQTTFGQGYIVAVDQNNKRVQVQLSWGATAYLSEEMIKHYLKAIVGTEVNTKFGAGRVVEIRPQDAIYTVRLYEHKASESPIVYVPESDLHRPRSLSVNNVQKQVQGTFKALASVHVKLPSIFSSQGSQTSASHPVHQRPQPRRPSTELEEHEICTAGI